MTAAIAPHVAAAAAKAAARAAAPPPPPAGECPGAVLADGRRIYPASGLHAWGRSKTHGEQRCSFCPARRPTPPAPEAKPRENPDIIRQAAPQAAFRSTRLRHDIKRNTLEYPEHRDRIARKWAALTRDEVIQLYGWDVALEHFPAP